MFKVCTLNDLKVGSKVAKLVSYPVTEYVIRHIGLLAVNKGSILVKAGCPIIYSVDVTDGLSSVAVRQGLIISTLKIFGN